MAKLLNLKILFSISTTERYKMYDSDVREALHKNFEIHCPECVGVCPYGENVFTFRRITFTVVECIVIMHMVY